MSVTAQAVIQQVTDTLYAPFRYSGAGIPEGVQTSEPGWIYRDTNNGLLWFKKTGSAATGWKAMPGTLFSNTTQASTVGASEYTLQTNTVVGGTLAADGDAIQFEYAGTVATGGFRTVKLKFGGSVFITMLVNPANASTPWRLTGSIIRKSATAALCSAQVVYGSDASISPYADVQASEITATLASDQIILLTGTSAVDNKIYKLSGRAILAPAP